MAAYLFHAGAWRTLNDIRFRGGAWSGPLQQGWIFHAGAWRRFF